MVLRPGAPAAQGRTGPRPLRRSLLAWPPSSWVDDDDRLRLSANPPPRRSERGKKESATDRRSRRCRRSAAPCWQSSPPPRPIDALTAREPSVERSNESAKVVLGGDGDRYGGEFKLHGNGSAKDIQDRAMRVNHLFELRQFRFARRALQRHGSPHSGETRTHPLVDGEKSP